MRIKYNLTDKQYNLLARMNKTFDHNWPVLLESVMSQRTYNTFEQEIFNKIRIHYISHIQNHGYTIPKIKPRIYITVDSR